MVKALVSQFGTPLPADPTRHAFPTPDQLAATEEETLRSATRLGYRAPYVLELSRSGASGALDLEGFKTADIPTPNCASDCWRSREWASTRRPTC
jgi:3-methyladenine DNA glycosylase/8-oxoguanine DNA glycosylase